MHFQCIASVCIYYYYYYHKQGILGGHVAAFDVVLYKTARCRERSRYDCRLLDVRLASMSWRRSIMRCFRAAAAASVISSSSSCGGGCVPWLSSEDTVDDIKRVFWDSIVPFDKRSNTCRRGNNPSDSDDSIDVVVVKALVGVIFGAIRQQRKRAMATIRKHVFIFVYCILFFQISCSFSLCFDCLLYDYQSMHQYGIKMVTVEWWVQWKMCSFVRHQIWDCIWILPDYFRVKYLYLCWHLETTVRHQLVGTSK